MSKATVFANGLSIACKAFNGKSISAFPDPCWSPPSPSAGPILIPYPNTAYAKDTANGSKTVFIGGKPIMLKDKSYFKTSTGNEAATRNFGMGNSTGVIQGKAYFRSWSMNVFIEGYNVCRHTDLMTHNHGSYPGNTPEWRYLDAVKEKNECRREKQRIHEACGEECKKKNCVPKNQDKWKKNHCEGLRIKPYDLKNKFSSLDELKKKLNEQLSLTQASEAILDQAKEILVGVIQKKLTKMAAKAALKKLFALGGPVGWIITGIDTALDAMEAAELLGKLGRIKDEVNRIKNDITGLGQRLENINDFDDATELMADTQRDIAVVEPCLRARKCMLTPYDDTQKYSGTTKLGANKAKGCCPGQTGHHLIPDSFMFNERSCSDGSKRDIKKKMKGPKVCKDYDSGKAPTICTEGTSWHKGSHKAIHQNFQSNLHDNGYSKTGEGVPMDAVREAALDSLEQTFPLSMCSRDCIERQLKNYYNQACESSKGSYDFGDADPTLVFREICPVETDTTIK
jgi:hypothetical protein